MFGYPAQTSLIPVQVALVRFLESQGPLAAFGNYPYWYLGTTPYRFLTGPILPVICLTLHRVFSSLSLFEIMFGVIGISWVVGAVGVYCLTAALMNAEQNAERRRIPALAALFYLLGPIVPFLFRFSDGLYLIAFSFLPFALLAYLRVLRQWERKTAIFCIITISFIILLNSLIIPTLFLGMAAIFLAQVGWKRAEEKLKQTFLIFTFSFLISTIWYTPSYWLTLLGAPSLAGKGLAGVIVWLGKILPTALAFGLAIVSVRFFKKKNLLRDFCFYWLFIFGFLTFIRFLSDPDFWLDWSSYGTELQFGVAIALGMIASKIYNLKSKILLFTFYFLLFTFLFNKYVLGTLQRDIEQTVEYRIGKWLDKKMEKGKKVERVFLSGTTAFWLNAFFDIPQVRGGKDEASVHPTWRQAAWEIRDGSAGASTELSRTSSPQEGEKSVDWLKELGVSYLVVHTQDSEEYYHDFSHPEKFEATKSLRKVFQERGDVIYRVEERD